MARAINGQSGNGTAIVYTLSLHDSFRVEVLTFTLVTSAAAGNRTAEVIFQKPDGSQIARVPDWNDVGPAATVSYTFAVGPNPFSCVVGTGGAIQHDLPMTDLEAECIILVRSVSAAGVVFANDRITDVGLWVEEGGLSGADDVVPPYTLVEQTA